MASSRQGVRSSRTGPIRNRDRIRMRRLDREIAKIDARAFVLLFMYPPAWEKLMAKRKSLDKRRRDLRHWMKTRQSN